MYHAQARQTEDSFPDLLTLTDNLTFCLLPSASCLARRAVNHLIAVKWYNLNIFEQRKSSLVNRDRFRLKGDQTIAISSQQIRQIRLIASRYENLECVECAQAIQDYLLSQEIAGVRLKLNTGSTRKPNNYIYDDSIGLAISENGRHEGVAVVIEGVEIVFDNHHPQGISRDEWLANLQFHDKLWAGKSFEITEEEFGNKTR